jgi:hypothetical protein
MIVGCENEKIHAGMDKIHDTGLKKPFLDAVRIGGTLGKGKLGSIFGAG